MPKCLVSDIINGSICVFYERMGEERVSYYLAVPYLCAMQQQFGFIFDMDGTMIDNMMVHHRAWQQILAEYGLPLNLDEVRRTIHGKNEQILRRLFGDRFSSEQYTAMAFEKEARYRAVFKDELALVAGLMPFLQTAHDLGIPMGIGTAAPPENVQFVLENLPIRPFFKTVVDASQVILGKPDPQVFRLVAEGMGVPIGACIVFEDSPTGVETAFRAGCPAVVVLTTHRRDEFERFPNVLCFVDDFTEIGVRLQNLLRSVRDA